jgi:large subunit ribosomal protein L5
MAICLLASSITAFKLREKVAIGCMVTLRRQNMWNFLDKLIHVAIPRVRDFRGISPRSFDGSGNYTMGIREQLMTSIRSIKSVA